MKRKNLVLILLCVVMAVPVMAQENEKTSPVDFSLQLKNNHLWRGYEISTEAAFATNIFVATKDKSFMLGVWGGAGLSGNYKELDYYTSYSTSGFTVALWDIYNFSPGAAYNNTNVFEYRAKETGRFIDLSVGYQFQGNFPLSASWATIVYGRDRDTANENNRFSTFVTLGYPIIKNRLVNLDLSCSGAFALNPEENTDAHFYANDAGIVMVALTASKNIKLGSYNLPVSVMGMWNPVNKNTNIQLAIDIF